MSSVPPYAREITPFAPSSRQTRPLDARGAHAGRRLLLDFRSNRTSIFPRRWHAVSPHLRALGRKCGHEIITRSRRRNLVALSDVSRHTIDLCPPVPTCSIRLERVAAACVLALVSLRLPGESYGIRRAAAGALPLSDAATPRRFVMGMLAISLLASLRSKLKLGPLFGPGYDCGGGAGALRPRSTDGIWWKCQRESPRTVCGGADPYRFP